MHYGDRKTAELCRLSADEHPSAVQLFGREPELLAEAAERLLSADNSPDIIDINMGCPMPKITKNGEGSALMREPELAGRIIAAVAKAASPAPVTVKLRSGWDDAHKNAVELAKIAEQAGAAALTIHGRTRAQLYAPPVDRKYNLGGRAGGDNPSVIGNGGVTCAVDALEMLAQTGCAGVAVARGAQGRPWIFAEIRAGAWPAGYLPSRLPRSGSGLRFCTCGVAAPTRAGAAYSSRADSSRYYIKGMPGAASARDELNRGLHSRRAGGNPHTASPWNSGVRGVRDSFAVRKN